MYAEKFRVCYERDVVVTYMHDIRTVDHISRRLCLAFNVELDMLSVRPVITKFSIKTIFLNLMYNITPLQTIITSIALLSVTVTNIMYTTFIAVRLAYSSLGWYKDISYE